MKPQIVLIHAAFAGPSSWDKVAALLGEAGWDVVVPELPLSSLADDVEALRLELRGLRGPLVLAAHSYGGAVMTAASAAEDKVAALVYIAAMAPDTGETVAELLHRAPPHPLAPELRPDAEGWIAMSPEGFRNAVAPNSTPLEIDAMVRGQKPIAVRAITEPMGTPGWREKPSWFLLAEEDRVIAAETQRFFADRMKARVLARNVDHTPLSSDPAAVVEAIEQAIAAIR